LLIYIFLLIYIKMKGSPKHLKKRQRKKILNKDGGKDEDDLLIEGSN